MWARMSTNLFTDVNSNMMRANKEKWISCKSATSLKMPDNSINAKLQYIRIHLSSARSNNYLGEPNVHIIFSQQTTSLCMIQYRTIILPKSAIYRRQLPIWQIRYPSGIFVVETFRMTTICNSIINSIINFPPLSTKMRDHKWFY